MKRFRILSLDGGGIRGAFTASCLTEIENRLGKPLAQYFDMIAGTSTGAIIAAGLASGKPAGEILEFYEKRGSEMFIPRARVRGRCGSRALIAAARLLLRYFGVDFDDLLGCRYSAGPLRRALREVFREATLDSIRESRLIIPAIDLVANRTVMFKTPHLPSLTRDRHLPIVDVLLAATAATTYFPPASMQFSILIPLFTKEKHECTTCLSK